MKLLPRYVFKKNIFTYYEPMVLLYTYICMITVLISIYCYYYRIIILVKRKIARPRPV